MEIHFQHQQQQPDSLEYAMIPLPTSGNKVGKFRGRRNNNNNKKYVGVRQRPSGRWVAEIKDTTQKIRMWLGTFETAEDAARAYDEAACLLRGTNTRTNFVTLSVSHDSPLASRIKNLLSNRNTKTKTKTKTNTNTNNNQRQTPTTSSNASGSSPTTSSGGESSSCVVDQKAKEAKDWFLFDDAYKPDLSNCNSAANEQENVEMMRNRLSSWGRFQLQTLQAGFNHQLPKIVCDEQTEFSEFERMKVERQISASLYAMNGVQEYMETVVSDPLDSLWDLPPLCSLLC